jgi:hypothetical protein
MRRSRMARLNGMFFGTVRRVAAAWQEILMRICGFGVEVCDYLSIYDAACRVQENDMLMRVLGCEFDCGVKSVAEFNESAQKRF